jgi:hypothetical protein
MGDTYWLFAFSVVLLIDLAIGIAVGWFWRGATGAERDISSEREAFEQMFRRNDELFRVIYTLLRQSREYMWRFDLARKRLSKLPPSAATRVVVELIESVQQMHGTLTTTHNQLQRQVDLSQEATAAARQAHGSIAESKPPPADQPALGGDADAPPGLMATIPVEAVTSDARSEERHPYHYQQMVAPYVGGKIPTPEMFKPVQCCDLSSGGVSFLMADRLRSDMIVITVGDERNLVYRTARVVQITEVQDEEECGGVFRVGCQFTGRLHRHLFA